jgi:hypothetical protein
MVESENASQIKSNRRKKMKNSNNTQAVAVKTRVNAGGGFYKGAQQNHNETVAVKTQVSAGRDPQSGLPTGQGHGIIAVL